MKFTRPAILAGAVMALAVPAGASAHPSVYTGTAKVVQSPGPPVVVADQTRHMVTNHGYTTVLRESNGVGAPGGVVSYALLPGALRTELTQTEELAAGGTAAQAHATCQGNTGEVADLWTEAAITGWQEGDPFYNYVPFQSASAGLDDNPADWIDDVQALTGVNLTQVSDLAAACAGIGGTFAPADATQNTIAALASGTVEHETAPLIAEIDQLTTFTERLEAQKAAAERAAADARAALRAAPGAGTAGQAVARLRIEQVGGKSAAPDQSVKVTGPAGMRVVVRLRLTRAAAKAAGWKSLVLAKETVTIGQDGTALVDFALGKRARAALRKAKASGVYFAARSGDRWATTRTR
jgi:hypothetical protein